MPTTHNFNEIVKEYQKFRRTLPRVIGQEAVKFAKDNFRRQGFQDNPFQKWKKRKPGAERNKGRAILVDSGRLKRSVRVTRIVGNLIYIGSNVPYAKIHNEGGRITGQARVRRHTRRTRTGARTTVRAHTRRMDVRMPQRKFIGASTELNRRVNRAIRLKLLKAFKAS